MNVLLLSHSTGIVGPIDFLENYCLKRKHTVYKIQHPLDNYHKKETLFFKDKKKTSFKLRRQIGLINLFFDIFISLQFILNHNIEIGIGANNLDTLTILIAKKYLKRNIKYIIYFASDFSEKRFNNTFLDSLYLQIEKYVLKNADITVSNTKRAEKKRIELGLSLQKSVIVPNGVDLEKKVFRKKKMDKTQFIFVGNVTKEHGLIPLLEKIHPLIKKLVVIGQGEQWQELKTFIKKHNVDAELYFAKSHSFVIDSLQKFSGIGLAPYNTESKWTYYCSPLKVNEYISCGIPVVISNVPEISQTIKKEKLGIIYDTLSLETMKKTIDTISFENFYIKSKKFYEQYNYDTLYKVIPYIN